MTIEFVDELPPQARSRRSEFVLSGKAEALHNNPGRWAVVARRDKASTAHQYAAVVRKTKRSGGVYEATVRVTAEGRTVFARWVSQ